MNIKIIKPVQGGTVRAIASKSEAHRLLICAALADSDIFISCSERSQDIDATVHCLDALGAEVRYDSDGFYITPINRQKESQNKSCQLDCGESGSTLRFLLPVCGALGLAVQIHMRGRLPARPLSALYEQMVSHGCKLSEQGQLPLTCEGLLESGTYNLPGNISSQYVSGLLFALPLLSGDSVINVSGVLESRPYVDITLDALRLFGITITEEEKQVFKIPGGQTFRSPEKAVVGGDWSNAAFWLVAGAIGQQKISCTILNPGSQQGDKNIVEMLKRFGANVDFEGDAVTVSPCKLRGIDIDAGDIPDLIMALAAVASVAEGTTKIYNAERLRMKESDRLSTVTTTLSNLGVDIIETENGLVINGKKTLTGGEINSCGDHRIVMMSAVLSVVCTGQVIIKNGEAVNKSYPGFFDDFKLLGGICEEV